MKRLCTLLLSALLIYPQAALAWKPTDIAGCQLWLKADAIVGLNDGDPVSTWSDLSGQGHNTTQPDNTKQPVYKTSILNGMPVVRFGATVYVLLTTSAFTLNAPSTIFLVGNRHDTPSYQNFSDGLGGPDTRDLRAMSTNHLELYAGADFNQAVPNLTSYAVIGGIYNGASSVISVNGAVWTGNAGSGAASGIIVGNNSGSSRDRSLNGDIAEFIAYNSALSATDRKTVEGYLACRWGLQSLLPVGHPYKTACPGGAPLRKILNAD